MLVAEIPTGFVGDRIGRRNTLVVSSVVVGAAVVGFAYAETTVEFLAVYVAWEVSQTFRTGNESAWLYDTLSESGETEAFSRVRGRGQAVLFGMTAIAALVGGVLATRNIVWPFLATGAVNVVAAVVLLTLPEPSVETDAPTFSIRDALDAIARLARPGLRGFVAFVALFLAVGWAADLYVQPISPARGLEVLRPGRRHLEVMTESSARAFVPGHVTGLFSVHRHEDPARTGSRGVGLTLTDGVSVEVTRTSESETTIDGDAVPIESVDRVLDTMGVDAAVHAQTEVPLGAGFGVSGAVALGTAYAANTIVDDERSENELVWLAHVAEVEAGSGLGDVVAQARGGAPIRLEPGAPPHGRLDGIPETSRVEYVTFGELSTETVLSGGTETLSAAGETGFATVRAHPTLEAFMAASRTFARDAELLTDDVAAVIDAVADAGGSAAMAMLGRTVFALETGLTDAGYDPAVCRIHPAGATIR